MSTDKSTAAGAWSMKEFFRGECGFSRMMNLILVLYIIGKDSKIATFLLGS